MDLGPGEREHDPGAIRQRAECTLDRGEARIVRPLQVLQDYEDGPPLRLCAKDPDERVADVQGHRARVLSRGAKERMPFDIRRCAEDLREEDDGVLEVLAAEPAREVGAKRRGDRLGRFALRQVQAVPDEPREQPEGPAGSDFLAPRDQDVQGAIFDREPRDLPSQSRLAQSRRRGDERDARDGFLHGLLDQRAQVRDLPGTPHVRRSLPEDEPLRTCRERRGLQHEKAPLRRDVEPIPHEVRRERVEADVLAVPGCAQERSGPVDRVADGDSEPRRRPPGRDGDDELGPQAPQRASATDRRQGLIARRDAPHQAQDAPVGQSPHVDAERGKLASSPDRVDFRQFADDGRGLRGIRARAEDHRKHSSLSRADDPLPARQGRAARELTQRLGHIGRVGEALGRILLEQSRKERVERLDLRVLRGSQARRLSEEDLRDDRHHGLARERGRPRHALVEHGAEREEIRRGSDRAFRGRLLGRHVRGRPEQHPDTCPSGERARHPGDAEVEDANVFQASPDQEDVPWLDVAVNDPRRVRGRERVGHPRGQRRSVAHGERATREQPREVLPLEPLHRQIE